MSKIIASAVFRASNKIVGEAEQFLNKAIAEKGQDFGFEFPDTGYHLPMYFSMTGIAIKTLGEMRQSIALAKTHLHSEPDESIYKPYLGEALDAGMATLYAEEVLMALRYIYKMEPYYDKEMDFTYNGFITDTILRDLGFQLVDGSMPGFAAIIGAAESEERAVKIVMELQQRNVLTFLSGHNEKGDSVTKQLHRKGVQMGWETRIVPLGPETEHTIYALNWAARSALTFGGIKGGDFKKVLKYNQNRVFAFALALGPMDDLKWATGAGAINMGFPAICDTDVPEIRPRGVCTYEHVVKELDQDKLIQTCIEVRGVKLTMEKPPIPVAFGQAFEGERIRKEDTFIEAGGNKTPAFELIRTKEMNEVENGKVEIVGLTDKTREIIEKGGALPLGIVVDVAGRKMQPDFEPVIERKLHDYINAAQGIWHMGQRDIIWLRISNNAHRDGFNLEHIGVILQNMVLSKFPAIVDKAQVTLYVDEAQVNTLLEDARKIYMERNDRIANMKDETTDTFYSCLLCQSFAPNHLCVVSPERLGLCGAVSWLDAKAAFEIDPTGGNQPVPKGKTLDEVNGRWEGVDKYLWAQSHQTLETFSAYSIMTNPMTSCGCFECIVAVVPEANGFMIVDRGFTGMTPIGMKFSSLAGTVGGGAQTPGFLGIGKYFITSRKFLTADGGFPRIVWMPKSLKQFLGDKLYERAKEVGFPDLPDQIADETIATESEELVAHLTKVNHPALNMPSII